MLLQKERCSQMTTTERGVALKAQSHAKETGIEREKSIKKNKFFFGEKKAMFVNVRNYTKYP